MSVIIGSILAVAFIVIGGAQYMTTDMYQKKTAGKERIKNAVLGLVFLIAGYLIFSEINPRILTLDFNYPSKTGDRANSYTEDPANNNSVESDGSGSSGNNYNFQNFIFPENSSTPMFHSNPKKVAAGENKKFTDKEVTYGDISNLSCLSQAILWQESSGGSKKGMGSCTLNNPRTK
jgi:hypothetical protein